MLSAERPFSFALAVGRPFHDPKWQYNISFAVIVSQLVDHCRVDTIFYSESNGPDVQTSMKYLSPTSGQTSTWGKIHQEIPAAGLTVLSRFVLSTSPLLIQPLESFFTTVCKTRPLCSSDKSATIPSFDGSSTIRLRHHRSVDPLHSGPTTGANAGFFPSVGSFRCT